MLQSLMSKVNSLVEEVANLKKSSGTDTSCTKTPILDQDLSNLKNYNNLSEALYKLSFFQFDEEKKCSLFFCRPGNQMLVKKHVHLGKKPPVNRTIASGLQFPPDKVALLMKGENSVWYHFKETLINHIVPESIHHNAMEYGNRIKEKKVLNLLLQKIL